MQYVAADDTLSTNAPGGSTPIPPQQDQILPTLELFTEGLLTSRRMLDDYLLYVGDPPEADANPDPEERPA